MGWTANTNRDSIEVRSTLQITDGRAVSFVGPMRLLPADVDLSIRHPSGHITLAKIVAADAASAEIRLSDRTRWRITPFDSHLDLPILEPTHNHVQVWVVRKLVAKPKR